MRVAGSGGRALLAAVALLPIAAGTGAAFRDPPAPEAAAIALDELLARMREMDRTRAALLEGYTSVRLYTLDNQRFGTHAEIRARMSFTRPGTKTFEVISERGSGTIRKRVLHRMIREELEASGERARAASAITPANYAFRLLGTARVEDRTCYLLEAEPRRKGKFLIRGRIWVDAEDFAIVRIEGSPEQKPSFLIRKTAFVHTYGKFGPFWLPLSNRSESDVLIYGKTGVAITYHDYVVNGHSGATAAGEGPLNAKQGGRTQADGAGALVEH